jgi:hypothetical protein
MNAAGILKVGKRVMPEVLAQRELRDMPCAPAYQVYTGVLYPGRAVAWSATR